MESLNVLVLDDDLPQAVPCPVQRSSQVNIDMPENYHPALESVLKDHKALFSCQLGKTNVARHVIDTGDSHPVKLPPRPIPFHYTEQVHNQLQEMAKEGIIRQSNSPWCAPAVYVPKSNGEVRICVDFVQLNKLTKKDSYPVPRADGPQQKLAGKKIFSKIDLRSAYWQFPMSEESIEKTAFCPGPGYGLWEFTVMPYGLTGATQTCQRGLDEVLKNCKDCVDNYVDDCIIFSDTLDSHIDHLQRVLGQLQSAGFTLRGSKCCFGMSSATHLGFDYSGDGIKPSAEKARAIVDWPLPTSQKEVRSFLGLANFYRRFIPQFSSIAAPLNDLTSSKAAFKWTDQHQAAFNKLKGALSSPPILDYPRRSDTFVLTTDASELGVGAVLSTSRGTVVEYASRSLTAAEKKYCTSEQECLAIVWATRKLRHYLIGARFTLETDHKPLEWLESARQSQARAQRLERWALELRAFEFDVVHRPGKLNQHADALSRCPVAIVGISPSVSMSALSAAQLSDPVLSVVHNHLRSNKSPPATGTWSKFPLKRYRKLWSQLLLQDSVVCRKVKSPSMSDTKLLIVVPPSHRKVFLTTAHEESGHQGIDRTLSRLSEVAYWVGMGKDVVRHCTHCFKCQVSKAPPSKPAPLQPVISSKPWELVAVDILKVPRSAEGNQYLLVVQDYFSKWPFARPIADQTADRIVQVLRDEVFTLVGPPQRLHSDQGRNFESRILGDLCTAFGVKKSHTTPYHPMGDGLVERMNRSLLTLLRTYVERENDWERHLQLLLFVYRTTRHSSTGLSPYEVLFGYNPPPLSIPELPGSVVPDPSEYSAALKSKLLELREIVDSNIVQSAEHNRTCYEDSGHLPQFKKDQRVLLSNPIKGKLSSRWSGPWTVESMKNDTTVVLRMGAAYRTVHVNRVRPLLEEDVDHHVPSDWVPPLFSYEPAPLQAAPDCSEQTSPGDSGGLYVTRSGRTVRPVQRYGNPSN